MKLPDMTASYGLVASPSIYGSITQGRYEGDVGVVVPANGNNPCAEERERMRKDCWKIVWTLPAVAITGGVGFGLARAFSSSELGWLAGLGPLASSVNACVLAPVEYGRCQRRSQPQLNEKASLLQVN